MGSTFLASMLGMQFQTPPSLARNLRQVFLAINLKTNHLWGFLLTVVFSLSVQRSFHSLLFYFGLLSLRLFMHMHALRIFLTSMPNTQVSGDSFTCHLA